MKYRITIDVFIDPDDLETVKNIRKALVALRHRFRTIRKGLPGVEYSRIVIHRCYHDEEPSKPCEVIYEWSSE